MVKECNSSSIHLRPEGRSLLDRKDKNSEKEVKDYLERKYGKEPRVTAEELDKIRWSWH